MRDSWLYRTLFPHFFSKIHYELTAQRELFAAAQQGIFIYVAKNAGQLEHQYYAHLFHSLHLPPLGEHPEKGDSALLSLPASTLEDDLVFLSPHSNPLLSLFSLPHEIKQRLFLIPLEFIWDKRPSPEQRSLFDLLFGEKEDPGLIRKLLLFFRNYKKRALAKVGAPIAFAPFDSGGSFEDSAKRLYEQLVSVMHRARRATTGPKLRPRSWMISRVLSDELLEQRLTEIAVERGKHPQDVLSLATDYMKEIAADIDHRAVELYDKIFQWILRSLYRPPQIRDDDLQRLKQLVATRPVVLVPNHKSHLDYLLLSSLLNAHFITIPHIAAGMNLAFWPLGKMLRRGGAYFIRRSFRENRVYREVLQAYLRVLFEAGYVQEFFIEGGRSRTGKLLPPRLGLLTMLLQGAAEGKISGLTFVPVAITYDHVIEQPSYAAEQSGQAKRAESQRDIVKLTRFFARRGGEHGDVYIRFGESLAAPEASPTPQVVCSFANAIAQEINRHLIITPLSLIAASLLTTPKRGILTQEVWERVELFLRYLQSSGAPVSESLMKNPRQAFTRALQELEARRLIRSPAQAFLPFTEIPEDRRLMLDYMKNGAMHAFVTPALISHILLSRRGKAFAKEDVLGPLQDHRKLFAQEFQLSSSEALEPQLDHVLSFFIAQEGLTAQADAFELTPKGELICSAFKSLITNFMQSYSIAVSFLETHPAIDHQERQEVGLEMLRHGDHLLSLGRISYPEARSRWNIEQAIDALIGAGILEETRVSGKIRRSLLTYRHADLLLTLKALLQDNC